MTAQEKFRQLLALKGKSEDLHGTLIEAILGCLELKPYDPMASLVDTGFMLREIEGLFDELRKEAKAKREHVDRMIGQRESLCLLKGTPERTHGHYATGSVKRREETIAPTPGSPEFHELMDHFQLPQVDARALIKFRFQELSEYYQQCADEGRPKPPVPLQSFEKIVVHYRRRKNV